MAKPGRERAMQRMRHGALCGALALAAGFGGSVHAKSVPPDYGAQPTWDDFKAIGERALRASLVDPDSARIEWPYIAVQGSLKPFLSRTAHGYWTCGLINARNRMGGYTGAMFFLIMQKNGAVTSLDIGQVGGSDTATITCSDALKKGNLRPAPAPAPVPPASVNPAAAPKVTAQAGVDLTMVPQGAYIAAVRAGSIAERSGLKVGQVIAAVNGIPVAGMAQATVIAMLDAARSAKLTIAGQGEVILVAK